MQRQKTAVTQPTKTYLSTPDDHQPRAAKRQSTKGQFALKKRACVPIIASSRLRQHA